MSCVGSTRKITPRSLLNCAEAFDLSLMINKAYANEAPFCVLCASSVSQVRFSIYILVSKGKGSYI